MPRFVSDSDHTTIQAPWWAEKEVCVIRRFAYGDRQYLAGQTVSVGIDPSGGVQDSIADIEIERMNLAILERGIVSWTDAEGQDMLATAEAIAALEEDDAGYILAEINTLNPSKRRSPKDQERFRGAGRDRDPEPEQVSGGDE